MDIATTVLYSLILSWKSAKVMLFIHITKLIASGQDKLTALGFQ